MLKKILIVEDEEPVRKALKEAFGQEDLLLFEAQDGEEGFNLALKEQPDLILLNIIMPKMDGITMMKKVRESGEWGKTVPIILLTVMQTSDLLIKDIEEYKPAFYLIKTDWKLNDIVTKAKELLK